MTELSGEKKRKFTVTQQWDYFNKDWPELKNEDYMKYCADHGVTSLQSYVYWASVEKKRGEYLFDFYDDIVSRMTKYGLKWVPFIIAGPAYATPDWFHSSNECVYAKCLEHGEESRIQSIWNPHLVGHFDGLLEAVSKRFDHDDIESVLIGISGNWGEALYPVGGGFNIKNRPFHTHLGWWCGDAHAGRSFKDAFDIEFPSRRELKMQRYASRLLSIAHERFDNALVDSIEGLYLKYLEKKDGGRYLQRIGDFADWYISSMTGYLDKCMSRTRAHFPKSRIYAVTGGDGNPMTGADFTQQAKAAKKYDAGIRITNQTDDYVESSVMTRWTATAAKLYDGYFTTEEAIYNSPSGIKARLQDATTSGTDGIYFKTILDCRLTDDCELRINGMGESGRILKDNLRFIDAKSPIDDTALLLPSTTVRCSPFFIDHIYKKAITIYQQRNIDFICEGMIEDGHLDKYKSVFITHSALTRSKTRELIFNWQKTGGEIKTDITWSLN